MKHFKVKATQEKDVIASVSVIDKWKAAVKKEKTVKADVIMEIFS